LGFEVVLWAVVAALAFVGELLSISFFLLFFALGAAVALVVALLGAGIVAQIVGFVVTSLLSLVVLRPVLTSRLSLRGGERYVSRALITGKSGIVTNAIEPIYTILLQRRDLELQRDELRLTRVELHSSAEAQKEQALKLKEAADLNAFTALLNVYNVDLEPYRDIIRDPLRERASLNARLERESLSEEQRLALEKDIQDLEERIGDQRAQWDVMLSKRNAILSELESRVRQGTSHRPPSSG